MTEKEGTAVLKVARELLTPEEAWVQDVHARDELGAPCWPGHGACQWCLVGAIEEAAHRIDSTQHTTLADAALDRVRARGPQYVARWNDQQKRTHAEVLALLDRAIAA